MKRFLLAVLFALLIVACRPPVVDPVDPWPPTPPPIVDTDEVTGTYAGHLRADANFFVNIELTLIEEEFVVTGFFELLDEVEETIGTVRGEVVEAYVELILEVTDGNEIITIYLIGVVHEGVFIGTFAGLLGSSGAFYLVRVE